MCKAWKLLKVIYTFCVAHGIHNQFMKDCLPKLAYVPDLLDKVPTIINKLRYHQHELEEEFNRLQDQTNSDLLDVINKARKILDADSASSYMDSEDLGESNDENGSDQCSSTLNHLLSLNQTDSKDFTL